ncbi:MAG: hypothetical protein J6U60_02320, partial [Clostridia bacterium]|nr:hypothetical protein [Clostridia bacterium]
SEMKYSSVQVGALHKELKSSEEKNAAVASQSAQAISQEIRYSYKQNQTIYDGLATMLTQEVGARLASMDERVASMDDIKALVNDALTSLDEVKASVAVLGNLDADTLAETVKEKVSEVLPQLEEAVAEIKYSYLQHQAIYDGLTALISGEVVAKLDDTAAKLAALEQIDKSLEEIHAKVAEGIALFEDADYKTVIESVAEKTEESVSEHSRQILDAVAAIPVAENVDYNRIVDEVGDKMLEILGEVVAQEPAPAPVAVTQPVQAEVDYDKIIYGTAEKVVESLPYPEKVDYRRIDERFTKAAQNVQVTVPEEVIAKAVSAAVEQAMAALDINAIADAVAARINIPVPVVEQPEIDYELLSDMVVAKLAENVDQTYDVVLDETGIEQIADRVSEKVGQVERVDYDRIAAVQTPVAEVDYDRIAAIVEEKTAKEEPTYELVIDEEGMNAIAENVSRRLCDMCAECAVQPEEPVEEVAEEPVEETVEEPVVEEPQVEEVVEEPVVEEPQVEEPVVEEPVTEELAVAAESEIQEVGDQLVDAETGLVIRLKKSFTAKLKQSEEQVKGYYSDIKNALTSYKKINSNVSWHGDRFNFGRETVAKMAICGKTLCLYLALDPENPELKQTVYHQKNVGDQRAHEATPFMVKIKSDAAAKKAVRLIAILAESKGAVAKENFEAVDYVEEFAYASTKQLFDDGYIKVTKEKKVEFDF